MSIQFLGDLAIPPEVTSAAAKSGLGDVRAVHQVPHRRATSGDEAKANVEKDDDEEDPERVYLCREGFVLSEYQDPVRAFRWTDFTAIYRNVTGNHVDGRLIFTILIFQLVMADGGFIVFRGVELPNKPSPTEILKLGPVLEEEMVNLLLPPAAEAVDAGGEVDFGPLTLSSSGVTTPEGHLPWNEIDELSSGAGQLVLGSTRRASATYSIRDIPNFQVFWTLAENQRARHSG